MQVLCCKRNYGLCNLPGNNCVRFCFEI